MVIQQQELVGGRSRPDGGGDHACSGGGYTAGNGESGIIAGQNGLGSTAGGKSIGAGGGYYTKGSTASGVQAWFNQGGMWYNTGTADWPRDHAGSGGNAGAGGTVYYYDLANIHAYNGDRITNGDYTTTYYEYDENGNLTTTVASTVTKQDGTVIVPTKIFAQAGIIRATYYTNQHMTQAQCTSYGVSYMSYTKFTTYLLANVQITSQTTTATTGYGQGIGSGAGNLEKSNGTLKSISELE